MDDIDHVVLSDISEVNPPTDLHGLDNNAMVSFIPMADVSESGEWINQQARPFKDVRNGYTCFQEDDILFAKITPCMENGKGAHAANLLNGIGFGTTEFHILRAQSRAHPRFIYHWTMSEELRRKAQSRMMGSAGQRRVPASFFSEFKVPVLPLPEQRRITEILDTIDEAIQKTEALILKLKTMKQGLLHDLLTRGLDENGKPRDPKAHPEQFKNSPLGRIPKEWKVDKLAKLVIRAEYGISVSLEDNSGSPVLRMNNLVAGEVDLSELKYSRSREASNLLLNPRDVLFNRTNSMEHVGRTAIWRGQLEGISFASYLVRIVPDYSKLIPEYLNLWLNSQSTQILIRKYATPSVHQVNINPTNLQKADITLPQSVEEQYTIVDAVDAHDARIRTEEQYRDKLKLQKKGLMHDLLTGKVRVKG